MKVDEAEQEVRAAETQKLKQELKVVAEPGQQLRARHGREAVGLLQASLHQRTSTRWSA